MRFNDGWGSLNAYAGVSPFQPAAAHFPSVSHPFMSTPIAFLGIILNLLLAPICYSRVGHLPQFHRGSFLESDTLPCMCLFSLHSLLSVFSFSPHQDVPVLVSWGLAARSTAWSPRSLLVSLPPRSSYIFISWSPKCPACSSPYVAHGWCRIIMVDQLFDGNGKLLQGLANNLGFHFQMTVIRCSQVLDPKWSSRASMVLYITTLGTWRISEAWPCRTASSCMAFTQAAHLQCPATALNWWWITVQDANPSNFGVSTLLVSAPCASLSVFQSWSCGWEML